MGVLGLNVGFAFAVKLRENKSGSINQNYASLCVIVTQRKICLSWEIYHFYSLTWPLRHFSFYILSTDCLIDDNFE